MIVRLALAILAVSGSIPPRDAAPSLPPAGGAVGALHLRLTKSEPAKDQTVAPPSTIRLWFSLAPELAVTTVRLTDAAGQAVPLSPVRRANAAGAPIEAGISHALAPGRYTVAWKTSSRDGHPMKGEYSFTVRAGG